MFLVKQNISYKYNIIRLSYPSSQNSNNYILKSWTSGSRHPFHVITAFGHYNINLLQTKRRLLYLKTQFVPRYEQFSSRL